MRQRDRQGHSTVGILFLTLILLSPSLSSFAYATTSHRPSWTEQAMFHFGDEVFFVGQASCAKTSEEGRQRAFAQGVQEIVNYAQAQSLEGVRVTTQMVFEDISDPRCPSHTTTVWRLLRVDSRELVRLAHSARSQRLMRTRDEALSTVLHLPLGITRRDVFSLLGRPASIEIGQDGTSVLDYQSVIVVIGRDGRLIDWRPTQLDARGDNIHRVRHVKRPDLPVVTLNDQSKLPPLNVVYNKERFAESIVVTQRHGEWPICAVLNRAEIVAELLDGFRGSRPPVNPPTVNAWGEPTYDLHPYRRTSGLWTCREAQLFAPNPHDCRPW